MAGDVSVATPCSIADSLTYLAIYEKNKDNNPLWKNFIVEGRHEYERNVEAFYVTYVYSEIY